MVSRTPAEGVTRDASQEDVKLLYRCQSWTFDKKNQGLRHVESPRCGRKDQARRYVDLVTVVFFFSSEDGFRVHKRWVRGMQD